MTGAAVRVLDASLADAKDALGDDLVIRTIADLISPEAVEAGEPIRAADLLLIVGQVVETLSPHVVTMTRLRYGPGPR